MKTTDELALEKYGVHFYELCWSRKKTINELYKLQEETK
jgi:hypothetical protein